MTTVSTWRNESDERALMQEVSLDALDTRETYTKLGPASPNQGAKRARSTTSASV